LHFAFAVALPTQPQTIGRPIHEQSHRVMGEKVQPNPPLFVVAVAFAVVCFACHSERSEEPPHFHPSHRYIKAHSW
jgi:hypothetical protein